MDFTVNNHNKQFAAMDAAATSQAAPIAKIGAAGKAVQTEAVRKDCFQDAAFDPLQSSEPVADVPESSLVRDDHIGKLVNAAFNLPPPPMPNFAAIG